jgi:aryl-alcohol dehydrogenase-like predicted oxidoreductase
MTVSRLCLGTMNFGWSADEPTSFAIMDAAAAAGINFFDTADLYSGWVGGNSGGESETIFGKWLKNKARDSVILATKVRGRMWDGPDGEGLGRAHITQAVEDSLRRLNTDYIDLYQTHWPDENVPLEETLATLDSLVKAGKVRAIGCSNYTAEQLSRNLEASRKNGWARFQTAQPHYSMLHRGEFENDLMALCGREGLGVIPYSPLAAGFLTGKYTRENVNVESARSKSGLVQMLTNDPRAFDVLDVLRAIAAAHGVPVAQAALAWLLANPVVTAPIIGARTVAQLEALVGAAEVHLTADEVAGLNAVSRGF